MANPQKENGHIDGGYIILARQILESDIWQWKPPEWLKIWEYILLRVNYEDSRQFPRGTGYFCKDWEYLKGVTKHQWHECVAYLKETHMVTTQKTTRGNIIKVLGYNRYQNPSLYETDTETEAKPKQNRSKTDTICKELKKERIKESTIIMSRIENLVKQFPNDIKNLINEYLELARIQNKSGKITVGRKKRLLDELYLEWFNCADEELLKKDFREALRVSVNNEAPHINYIKKVMTGIMRKRKVRLKENR